MCFFAEKTKHCVENEKYSKEIKVPEIKEVLEEEAGEELLDSESEASSED
jgi:hypothetical protein